MSAFLYGRYFHSPYNCGEHDKATRNQQEFPCLVLFYLQKSSLGPGNLCFLKTYKKGQITLQKFIIKTFSY